MTQGAYFLDDMVLARRIVENATACAGLSYLKNPREYCAAVYPHDVFEKASILAKGVPPFGVGGKGVKPQSSCALFALGMLFRAGVDAEEVKKSAWDHIGESLPSIRAMAERFDAWVDCTGSDGCDVFSKYIRDACLILIGGPGFGGPNHYMVSTCADGDLIDSVDGGQESGNAIAARKRRLERRNGEPWLVSVDQHSTGRRVVGFVLPRLPLLV